MNSYLRSICFLIVVGGFMVAATFVIDAVFGNGSWWHWRISNIMHFVGGFYAVFFVSALFRYARSRIEISVPRWLEISIILGGALVLGVWWEWYEFLIDRYHVWFEGRESIMTYADNIGDLIVDFCGAVLGVLFLYRRRSR